MYKFNLQFWLVMCLKMSNSLGTLYNNFLMCNFFFCSGLYYLSLMFFVDVVVLFLFAYWYTHIIVYFHNSTDSFMKQTDSLEKHLLHKHLKCKTWLHERKVTPFTKMHKNFNFHSWYSDYYFFIFILRSFITNIKAYLYINKNN